MQPYARLIVALSLAVPLLGCGVIDGVLARLKGAPEGFTCLDDTDLTGGEWPKGSEKWVRMPAPLPLTDSETGRWKEIDEGIDLSTPVMDEGDAHWWCEDEAGDRTGSYQRIQDENAFTRVVEGGFDADSRTGSWRGWLDQTEGTDPRHRWFEGAYQSGLRSGPWTWYCDPGCMLDVVIAGNYEADAPVGTWLWFAEDEQITANYRDGKLHGAYSHTWGDDELSGVFTSGQRRGTWVVTRGHRVIDQIHYDPPEQAEIPSTSPPARSSEGSSSGTGGFKGARAKAGLPGSSNRAKNLAGRGKRSKVKVQAP